MKNVALYYFSGMDVLNLIQTNPECTFHFIDPYLSNKGWEDLIKSKTRTIWASLEQNSYDPPSKLLQILMPYIEKRDLHNIMDLYHQLSPCIQDMGQVLYMAQRTLLGQLPTSQIVSYCEKVSRLWQACIKYFRIDLFIGTILPHSLTDYLYLDACISESIPTICPTATALSTCCQYFDFTNKCFIKLSDDDAFCDSQVIDDVTEFVQNNSQSISDNPLGYTKTFFESSKKRSSDYKNFMLQDNKTSSKILEYKHSLTMTYDRMVEDKKFSFDINEPPEIHALFLQYQPESSTCPQGNIYYNQLLVVEKILEEINDDGIIIIKEHPHQFFRCGIDYPTTSSHLNNILSFRSPQHYKSLGNIKQCYFFSRRLSASSLLDLPLTKVWNVGGTISIQSILRGIPLDLLILFPLIMN